MMVTQLTIWLLFTIINVPIMTVSILMLYLGRINQIHLVCRM